MSEKEEQTQGRDFMPSHDQHKVDADSPSLLGSKADEYGEAELGPRSTYLSTTAGGHLSQEHRDYLVQRHGTLDLDPIPSDDPADPYNWPAWKKNTNLFLVSFHSCMATFIAAGIIPAYENIAMDLHTTITRASYLTALQIAILGAGPLFWKPLANRYGRRPVWLISTLLSGVCNIGCAVSHSYASMAACRALVAFFISPAYIGSAVVTECFFKRERAAKMGVWTLLVTLGPPAGPFLMGFVAQYQNYRWIYWIFAIINFVQFVLYIFFGPETRYIRRGVEHRGSAFKQEYLNFKRIDPNPLKLFEFVHPFVLFKSASALVPSVAYAIIFNFSSVLLTVEIPQLFIPRFGFGPQAIGLQFLSIIIGSIIGEQIGGRLSDAWMSWRAKKLGGRRPAPEFRLWLLYPGFILAIVGLIVFCLQLNKMPGPVYNVSPIIGAGIAAVGNQIVTTVVVTYVVDTHIDESASCGVFIGIVRQTWAFIGPFWFPPMFEAVGIGATAGIVCGIIVACAIIPVAVLHVLKKGKTA